MTMTIPMGLTLLTLSSAASAWQPVVYPIRSQSSWQQSADAATCYSTASRQSGVNITRTAQSPMPPKLASGAVGIGGGGQVSQPPLPANGMASASATKGTTAGMPASAGQRTDAENRQERGAGTGRRKRAANRSRGQGATDATA
jgi:hypothetical protein